MAHKKGAGSTRNGRDSESKRLGVKLFGGQEAKAGSIIIRQRGTKYHPEKGVGLGKDHTIFATTDGYVYFRRRKNDRLYVSVVGKEEYEILKHGTIADGNPALAETIVEGKEGVPQPEEVKAKKEDKKEAKKDEPAPKAGKAEVEEKKEAKAKKEVKGDETEAAKKKAAPKKKADKKENKEEEE